MFWHRGPASKYLEDTDQILFRLGGEAGGMFRDTQIRPGGGTPARLLTSECLLASPPSKENAISV